VQRRIEQPDGHRQIAHDFEKLDEVCALHRQKLGKRNAAGFFVLSENHLAHRADPIFVEEHMLGAAKSDALGAEPERAARIRGRIGIGTNLELARGVGPLHQRFEFAGEFRLAHRHFAG